MKTAISIPDHIFDSAEALASRLGISRSQLYATALARLLAEHEQAQVTARLDALYGGDAGEPSRVEPGYAALQVRALQRGASGDADGDDQW
jgi:hypothetical protein